MTTRICAWHECNNPLIRRPREEPMQYARRETCCPSCAGSLANWRGRQAGHIPKRSLKLPPDAPDWPRVTGTWPAEWEETQPFAAHNLTFRRMGMAA